MNQCIVMYEDWQMQCCGIPFRLGDIVNWLVLKWAPEEIPANVGKIDYYYEAHNSDYKELYKLSGLVTKIRALHYKYENSPDNPRLQIPVSGCTVDVESADGWDKPIDDFCFSAYIVNLSDINIRPAEKSEVNFR